MEVNRDLVKTGWPSNLTKNSVSAIVRSDRVAYFKIGMTVHPERRAREIERMHGADFYDEMTVVYQTRSREHEQEVESMFLRYYGRDVDGWDMIPAGPPAAGRRPRQRPLYYVYICRKFL